jgi:acylpyruvate hydrolase
VRLVTIRRNGELHGGVLRDGIIEVCAARSALDLLPGRDTVAHTRVLECVPLEDAVLAPPSPAPGKIICVGLNYADHIAETGRETPLYPTLFAKFSNSLIGPRDDIRLPSVSEAVDYEAELGLAIGSRCAAVDEHAAEGFIAGYFVANDVSVRDWQWRSTQWLSGKSFDATTPMGPFLVTPDEIDGARDLRIECRIGGELLQSSSTSNLIFSPGYLVSYISRIMTLEVGDVILTGTPGGSGAFREPQRYLRHGEVMSTTIESLGEIRNACTLAGA